VVVYKQTQAYSSLFIYENIITAIEGSRIGIHDWQQIAIFILIIQAIN
jgi:hypothetical protein